MLFCDILTWLISSSLYFVSRNISEYILLRKYLFLVKIFNNPMISKDVYIIWSANLFLCGFWQICLGPLVFVSKEVENVLLPNILALSVPDEGYSRNTSCTLNFKSTFLFSLWAYLIKIILEMRPERWNWYLLFH